MSDFASLKGIRRKKEVGRSFVATSTSGKGEGSQSDLVVAGGSESASMMGVESGAGLKTPASGSGSGSSPDTTTSASNAATAPGTASASTSALTAATPTVSSGSSIADTEPYDSEGLYRELPSEHLEIRKTRTRGRGVWAKRGIRAGQTLLTVKPHATALSNDNLNTYCSKCCSPADASVPLMRCTGCRVVQYCDERCQSADWTMHKAECAALQAWMSSPAPSSSASSSSSSTSGSKTGTTIPGDAIRCLARILTRKKKLGKDSYWVRELDALGSHRTSLSSSPTSQSTQTHSHLAHALVQFLCISSQDELAAYGVNDTRALVDLVSQFTTNTFTLASPGLAPLGVCVSPVVALFNHGCEPNAVVVFPRSGREGKRGTKGKGKTKGDGKGGGKEEMDPMMHVVAIRDIEPGEEILTAYIDTTLPRERRQTYLKETYFFECDCGLCRRGERGRGVLTSVGEGASAGASSWVGDETVDLREAMWCPKKCGGVCWVPSEENPFTRCSKCKAAVKDTDAVLDALHVGQQALDKAEALQFSDPQKSIQLTTKLIPILVSAGLVPSSHPLLALSRLETSLLIERLPSLGVGGGPSSATLDENAMDVDTSSSSPVTSSSSSSPSTSSNDTKITPEEAQSALDDTIRSATRTSTGLSQILTHGHPVRGVALAELGKLLCVDEVVSRWLMEGGNEPGTPSTGGLSGASTPKAAAHAQYPPSGPQRLTLALQTLLRARSELLIGFGNQSEGGNVGEEVRELIVGVEREVGVWREGVRRGVREVREGRKK
ncbi:hypothetical protein BJ165DRAFT_1530272 [Panaeolus papilionaceus]|nr:hypothetical protein BJ165DRAFT_1530272 [Panaeolus papilionaceus]